MNLLTARSRRVLLLVMLTSLILACGFPSQNGGEDAGEPVSEEVTAAMTRKTSLPPSSTVTPTLTATATATPTLTFTPSVTPTFTPTPTAVPIQVGSWEEIEVRSVCLEVQQEYPEIEGDYYNSEIDDLFTELLGAVGVQVVSAEPCDAFLSIQVTGTPYTVSYSGSGSGSQECYTGRRVEGTFSLSAEGLETYTAEFRNGNEPPNMISSCETDPSDVRDFTDAWTSPIVYHLDQIWGIQIPVYALSNANNILFSAGADVLVGYPPEELSPYLDLFIASLDSSAIRRQICTILQNMGPLAVKAVPKLTDLLETENANPYPVWLWELGHALAGITGESYNPDAAYWRAWWDTAYSNTLEELIDILDNGTDNDLREQAATILGIRAYEDLELVIPALVRGLARTSSYHNDGVRRRAIYALAGLGNAAEPAIPDLIGCLDSSQHGGVLCRNALADIGVIAIPALIEKAEENKDRPGEHTEASLQAMEALAEITGETFDENKFGTGYWTGTVDDFVARCWIYYEEHGSN